MFARWKKRRAREKQADEREKELRRMVLEAEGRSSPGAKKAIAYCELSIKNYEEWFEFNEARWLRWQRTVIVGGVVATLAGVITLPADWISRIPEPDKFSWIRGVPAAITTIAASFLSSFTYREDAVRHELTANALWNELAKFQGGAAPYDKTEKDDTSAFLNVVCQLVENELQSWGALVTSNRAADDAEDAKKK